MKTAPSVLALLASASLAAAVPVLQTREPHFGEVLQPQAGYVLFVNDSTATNDTVAFQYRNGGRYDNTTCTISLQNDTATYTVSGYDACARAADSPARGSLCWYLKEGVILD